MSSNWMREITAIIRKELRSEQRSKSATYTAMMLSGVTVFTLAFAFYGRELTSEAAAGMLWAALLFSGVGTLTRSFIAEDEQGTGDLLRMWANPHAVYWGKAAYGLIQMVFMAFVVTLSFFVLTSVGVHNYLLLALTMLGASSALSGIITLISAMISRGNNRSTLGGVISLPLLLPLLAMGVTAVRTAIEGSPSDPRAGWTSCLGVWMYTMAVLSTAPYQFAAIWREP